LSANKGKDPVPVVDVFAGAGGLSEGFSAWPDRNDPFFRVALSIEKDAAAVQTLRLRSYFHAFPPAEVPADYYAYLRSAAAVHTPLGAFVSGQAAMPRFGDVAGPRCGEVWHTELGGKGFDERELDKRIARATGGRDDWVLLGGPPCQPFSTARGSRQDSLSADPRTYLYREYLSIIARHWPAVFVMENVKGIITARLGRETALWQVLEDLSNPSRAAGPLPGKGRGGRHNYRIWPLIETKERPDLFGVYSPDQYLIECERYGIPQRRHRVILLGIRDDISVSPRPIRPSPKQATVSEVLADLPPLRSGLARTPESRRQWQEIVEGGPPSEGWGEAATDDVRDSAAQWLALIKSSSSQTWYEELNQCGMDDVRTRIDAILAELKPPLGDRGGEYLPGTRKPKAMTDWYHDSRLRGTLNHSSREHMPTDHFRYFFAAAFAAVRGCSPRLRDFPPSLLPEHRNVSDSLSYGNFNDRFRVQLSGHPGTTIMSHLKNDGHYAIHPDTAQARSLTAREAARLQTFPDNYFFCGSRGDQYRQIGNAVPPFLSRQIAEVVAEILKAVEKLPVTIRRPETAKKQAKGVSAL
jgi:DNA (cytosine-5)-methyltransferase 1